MCRSSNKNWCESFNRTEFAFALALGTAEATGRETRKGEAGGSQEKGQTRSQCECIYRSQATPSGKFLFSASTIFFLNRDICI